MRLEASSRLQARSTARARSPSSARMIGRRRAGVGVVERPVLADLHRRPRPRRRLRPPRSRCATASGPSRSSRSLKSSPSRGGRAIATSRPSPRSRRGGGLGGAQAGAGGVVVGEDDDAAAPRPAAATCSRPEVDSVAQTGRPGQAVMTARPVSMPSQSAERRAVADRRRAAPRRRPLGRASSAASRRPPCATWPSGSFGEVGPVQADDLAVAIAHRRRSAPGSRTCSPSASGPGGTAGRRRSGTARPRPAR